MTLKHRRKFTPEFKLQVLAEITSGKSVAQAAREHQLHPTLIGRCRNFIVSTLIVPSRATVTLILTKLASQNSNAWLAASRWKTIC